MKNNFINFLKFKKHPKKRYIYAVTKGSFLGELLVFIKQDKEQYNFLSLPIMTNRNIPELKFILGIEQKIVEVVEKLPKNVYKVCEAQYKKNTVQNIKQ